MSFAVHALLMRVSLLSKGGKGKIKFRRGQPGLPRVLSPPYYPDYLDPSAS